MRWREKTGDKRYQVIERVTGYRGIRKKIDRQIERKKEIKEKERERERERERETPIKLYVEHVFSKRPILLLIILSDV